MVKVCQSSWHQYQGIQAWDHAHCPQVHGGRHFDVPYVGVRITFGGHVSLDTCHVPTRDFRFWTWEPYQWMPIISHISFNTQHALSVRSESGDIIRARCVRVRCHNARFKYLRCLTSQICRSFMFLQWTIILSMLKRFVAIIFIRTSRKLGHNLRSIGSYPIGP